MFRPRFFIYTEMADEALAPLVKFYGYYQSFH